MTSSKEETLLAVADSKLVLGNWYSECVMNGRALPDFASMLGMAGANYGHARALYRHLVPPEGYDALERGRGPSEIASMELLDRAPQDWEDFIATTWLAELATWQMMAGFLNDDDRTVAGLARRFGQEGYFHLRYCSGWLEVIGGDTQRAERLQRHFKTRWPLATMWLSGDDHASAKEQHEAMVAEVAQGAEKLGLALPTETAEVGKDWDGARRRASVLPAGLFEVIKFKDQALAH